MALKTPTGLLVNTDPMTGDGTAAFDQALVVLALARAGVASTAEPTTPPAEPILAVTRSPTGPIALTGAALLLGGITVLIGLRLHRRRTTG